MICFLRFLVLALAFFALPPGAALAGVRLECPERVEQGLPFYVRAVSDEPVRSVRFVWGAMRADVPAAQRDGRWEALAMFGTGVDARSGPGRLEARLDGPGGIRSVERQVRITARSFPEQRLTVDRAMVHLSDDALLRHLGEKLEVRRVLDNPAPERSWDGHFVLPLPGAVSSAFGLRRVFNGEPRAQHRGIDLRGAMGEPVKAIAPGRVVLAADHYFSGNSVYVDHGQGLVSMYFHLSAIEVRVGDVVAAGDVLGKVGKTGRATGPHLHFGLSVFGELVDPMPLVTGRLIP